jgi:hypothetical protein
LACIRIYQFFKIFETENFKGVPLDGVFFDGVSGMVEAFGGDGKRSHLPGWVRREASDPSCRVERRAVGTTEGLNGK